jgi:hypothetical protein
VSRRVSEACLSDLVLDRWLTGELPADQTERATAHVASCLSCRARREELARDREAFALAPPRLLLPVSLSETAKRRSSRGWVLGAVAALAVAAGVAFLWMELREGAPGTGSDRVASKGGGFELVGVVEHAGHQTRARSGDRVSPGDRVQLAYSTTTSTYLYVVGVDGTRRANSYFPEGDAPSRVEPGTEVELPFSLVIDETPGAESFYGVACAEARTKTEVTRGIETAGASAVLPGCEISVLTLEKRP